MRAEHGQLHLAMRKLSVVFTGQFRGVTETEADALLSQETFLRREGEIQIFSSRKMEGKIKIFLL